VSTSVADITQAATGSGICFGRKDGLALAPKEKKTKACTDGPKYADKQEFRAEKWLDGWTASRSGTWNAKIHLPEAANGNTVHAIRRSRACYPKVGTGFGSKTCVNKDLERSSDSIRTKSALVP
jgi:hypothetical protein